MFLLLKLYKLSKLKIYLFINYFNKIFNNNKINKVGKNIIYIIKKIIIKRVFIIRVNSKKMYKKVYIKFINIKKVSIYRKYEYL